MNITRSFVTASVFVLLSSATLALDPEEHVEHRSDAAVNSSGTTQADTMTMNKNESKSNEPMEQDSMAKMDGQMKVMNEMHEKMMNAKTPQERKSLMAEHMKAMQGGMAMMEGLPEKEIKTTMPANIETRYQALEKRMQLMETMMQMMMDRSSNSETLGV